MSVNLLELVQIKMGYPTLQKIDANTQEVVEDINTPNEHRFSQAAIPTVLTALYKFTLVDGNAEKILQHNSTSSWLELIFGETKNEAVDKVAAYAYYTKENAALKMNSIADNANQLIRENLPAELSIHDLKQFLTSQQSIFLTYLPAALQMGELLKDNTLDDQTHKMEGPISSLMHALGTTFPDGSTKKDDNF